MNLLFNIGFHLVTGIRLLVIIGILEFGYCSFNYRVKFKFHLTGTSFPVHTPLVHASF